MRTLTAVALCVLLAVPPAAATATTPQNEPPLADAGLDQTVRQGATVHLDATGSRDPDGEITNYEWRIETPNGTLTTPDCTDCARTTVVAAQTGTYSATVEVVDDDGATRSDTLYITVEPRPEGPTVSLAGPTRPDVGEENRYTASVTPGDAPVEKLVWRIGSERVDEDGTALDRAFDTTTVRTITVTVFDENGRAASDQLTVRPRERGDTPQSESSTTSEVSEAPSSTPQPTPSLTVSGPTTVFAAEAHAYTARTYDVPADSRISWQSGDEGSRVTRRWDSPGTYTIGASTTAHGTEVSDTLTVEVIAPSIEVVGPTQVKTEIFASFTARTSGVPDDATLTWDNGETGDTTGRKWAEPGTYTIEVTTTVAGRVISDTHTVNVTELTVEEPNKPPKVDIQDPGSLTAGEEVSLTAAYSDPDGRVVDVEWDPAQTLLVPKPGEERNVLVTVTDDDGAQASDEMVLQSTTQNQTETEETVKCYYKYPSEKTRNAPTGGCEASWGESWTQKQVSTSWATTVGRYDVTWVKIEERNRGNTETTTTDDPTKHCMGCNNLRDDDSGSNPTKQKSGETTSTAVDTGSYTKNGQTVHNDLTGDGVVNVIDWNRRFDNGYANGPSAGNSVINRGGPQHALRGANGQQIGPSSVTEQDSRLDDAFAPTSSDSNGPEESDGGSDVPGHKNADVGGTNGQVDANTDDGGFSRSEGQSTQDYKEEFTARL